MEQEFISQTPLDKMVGTDYGQMIKASIPYLPLRAQRFLSVYEKSRELMNTLTLFQNAQDQPEMQAMNFPCGDPADIFNEIRSFCYGESRQRLDQIINMMAMIQMIQLMNQPDRCEEESNE